jgi:three-Cys-motif partner protein
MSLDAYHDREQTAVKHEVLVQYLAAFVPIVGNWAKDVAYIDCLAGPWESQDPELADTSFAHAIGVLRNGRETLAKRGKYPTLRCLLIERNDLAFKRLDAYCANVPDIESHRENWDFTEHIDEVVRFAKNRARSFPFIFIDPKGWEQLEINLIAPILSLDPGEVLITFMTSFIARFLADETKHFHRLFGDDVPRLAKLQGEEREVEIVRSYASLVQRTGGFDYVCTLPVMKANQDAFQFYMIYATRHPKGVEVFKAAEKRVIPFMHEARAQAQHRRRLELSGQDSLFDPQAHYREKKFTTYREKQLDLAKSHLRSVLGTRDRVLFDDAWAITMQYSTVQESDLRGWIQEWRASGQLNVTNHSPRQKFPRKGQEQYLEWL